MKRRGGGGTRARAHPQARGRLAVPRDFVTTGYGEDTRLLAGAHQVDKAQAQGRKVLLFDDLYRSGATMNAISSALYDSGGAADVFALTITKSRSNQ